MAPTVDHIKKEVTDTLFWDARLDSARISVDVSDGAVTLRGAIAGPALHTVPQTDALSVPGVREVHDETVVERAKEPLSDEAIRASVENALRASRSVAASDVDVTVHEGVATLRGTVNALWKKARAEEIAADMRGVAAVANELAIAPRRSHEDKHIATAILKALERDRRIHENALDVDVSDAVATVHGRVHSALAFSLIRKAVERTSGVAGAAYDIQVMDAQP
jgi:osmotically-inducible protein OsmY